MISIKAIRHYAVIMTTIIILIVIIINSQTKSAFINLDLLERTMDSINNHHNEIYLPIKVLKNIASQDISDSERKEKLETAYENSINKILYNVDDILSSMNQVKLEANELIIFEIKKSQKKYLSNEFNRINNSVQNFEQFVRTTFTGESIQDIESIEILEKQYETIETDLLTQHKDLTRYAENIRVNYINIFNTLLFAAIFLVILMVFAVYRIIKKDFEFITRTYKQLENHDYDIEKVATKKPFFKEEIEMYNTVNKLFIEQKMSVEFKQVVSYTYLMDDILDQLLIKINKIFSVDRVGIAFIDNKRQCIVAEYGIATYEKILLNVGFEVKIESSSLKSIIASKTGIINNYIREFYKQKPSSSSLRRIVEEGIQSNMIIPLVLNDDVFGLVFFSSLEEEHFNENQLRIATKMIYEITGLLNRAFLMKVVLAKMTTTFAELVDKKDIETGDHIIRMSKYSTIIAEGIRNKNLDTHPMDKRTILEIERNASVHDIGKVAIPDNILKKPGKLTKEEWETMKTHSNIGGDIFKELRSELSLFDHDFYEVAEQIARYHHEKYDGSGYPEGLKGDQIPLVARIVALADVFDALTSERVYKKAFSFEKALEIIDESKGTHFDPVVVEAFYDQIDKIYKCYNEYFLQEPMLYNL